MPTSVWDSEVQDVIDAAKTARTKTVQVGGQTRTILSPFPSPQDWRDVWIYFIMVDRFNNPNAAPVELPFDKKTDVFQGGTLEGIRQQLGYLQELGVCAIWITPILKNCVYRNTYYGYAIQDFLQLDPRFASDPTDTEAELRALIDEVHARGMYVIFDVVLNHTGDVFAYVLDNGDRVNSADFRNSPYPINWRKADGNGNPAWTEAPGDADPGLTPDAAVWPKELRSNGHFRRQGKGGEAGGDFESLKELVTSEEEVRNALVRAHQYLIARYDVDGFRIDTLKFVEEDFARIFGNAMREFAQAIGKKNFFTFGEVYDNEEKIARFIGRHALDRGDATGVDAALDFPLFFKLPGMIKNQNIPPSELAGVFEHRKEIQRGIISSHSEASRFFVTFLDNHDQKNRLYFEDPSDPHKYDAQVTIGLACLFSLQGIPCVYYGTEQGLNGIGDSDESVREALWGKEDAFDTSHPFFQSLRQLSQIRSAQPALRYGRQYFRPLSGDGVTFGLSSFSPGVLAFSRILSDQEVVVVANTQTENPATVFVIVDYALTPDGARFQILFSNKPAPTQPGPAEEKSQGVTVHEVDGSTSRGPVRVIRVELEPMEVQILAK